MSKVPVKKKKNNKTKSKAKTKIETDYSEFFTFVKNMEMLCNYYGITNDEICEALDESHDTLTRRKKNPEDFRGWEMKIIANLLHTTVQELSTDKSGKMNEIFNPEV